MFFVFVVQCQTKKIPTQPSLNVTSILQEIKSLCHPTSNQSQVDLLLPNMLSFMLRTIEEQNRKMADLEARLLNSPPTVPPVDYSALPQVTQAMLPDFQNQTNTVHSLVAYSHHGSNMASKSDCESQPYAC